MKKYIIDMGYRFIIKIYNIMNQSDNPFSQHVIKDMDKSLEKRKPIEIMKEELMGLKIEIIHIKNEIRKIQLDSKDDPDLSLEIVEPDPEPHPVFEPPTIKPSPSPRSKLASQSWWWS